MLDPAPSLVAHASVANAHDHRLRDHSVDPALLFSLRTFRTDRAGATAIVEAVCERLRVVTPRLGFHARRLPETGHTRPPARITAGRPVDPARYPAQGHVQLSTTPTLGVIAHELAHHVVFHLDPPGTPAHGYRWVERYDQTAASVSEVCRL